MNDSTDSPAPSIGLKKEPEEPKEPKKPKKPKGPLTIRGRAIPANTKKGARFDEEKGILHLSRGSFPLYNPDSDPENPRSGDAFRSIWLSKRVRDVHDDATANWIKLNRLLKEGRTPRAIMAAAANRLNTGTSMPFW